LHNYELHNLYSSLTIVRVITSWGMKWAGESLQDFSWEAPREDLGVDVRITLRWTLMRLGFDVSNWIRLAQDRAQWRIFVSRVMNLRVS